MKNHVTVVPNDTLIIVDGHALRFDFPAPQNLHALQWHNGAGHMEWTDDQNHPLTPDDYEGDVAPFVTLWEAEKNRLDEIANRPPAPPTLAEVHTAKLSEIITGSNACASMVKGRYSALEIDSWAIQQTQAEAVLAGDTLADDALLTVLAAANGVPVTDFATRVMQNVLTAEALTKWVVSRQQYYETELKKIMADTETDDAAKIEAIQTLVVDFTLPEGANLMADPEVRHEQNG